MRRCGLLALLIPLGGMGALEPAPVWLWGEPEPRMLEVVGVGAQGLTVRSGDGTSLIGWPDVRDAGVDEAGAWLGAARDVWRARTRLARGDHVTAEPLLERAAGDYLGGAGPMSASIADGLLRCRLRRRLRLRLRPRPSLPMPNQRNDTGLIRWMKLNGIVGTAT